MSGVVEGCWQRYVAGADLSPSRSVRWLFGVWENFGCGVVGFHSSIDVILI